MKENKTKQSQDAIIAIQNAIKERCAVSFFVPVRKGNRILDAAFLYKSGSSSPVRARPFASVLLEPESGILLEYRNAYINDFMDPEKYPVGLEIDYSVPAARTAREQGEWVKAVKELYARIRELPFKDSPDEPDNQAAEEYRMYFFKAVPKALMPFYEALAPEFFQWLTKDVK